MKDSIKSGDEVQADGSWAIVVSVDGNDVVVMNEDGHEFEIDIDLVLVLGHSTIESAREWFNELGIDDEESSQIQEWASAASPMQVIRKMNAIYDGGWSAHVECEAIYQAQLNA